MSTKKSQTIKKIFKLDTETIYYQQYISLHPSKYYEKIKEKFHCIYNDDQDYDIIAKPGAGKTCAFINFGIEFGTKFILLTPYIANVKQLSNDHNLTSIYDLKRGLTNNTGYDQIVTTYDGLELIIHNNKIDIREYILVIDEYHNLFIQLGFRSTKLMFVALSKMKFKKVISITGTPEGVFLNNNKTIHFVDRNKPVKRRIQPIIIHSKPKNYIVSQLVRHIDNSKHNGKIVVFMNNKNALDLLKTMLNNIGITATEIDLIKSCNKESKALNNIASESLIPDGIKALGCTSKISDGVNINNEDIAAIYIVDLNNLIQFRQFLNRFRKFKGTVYYFVANSYYEIDKKKWPEFNSQVDFNIEKCKELQKPFLKHVLDVTEKNSLYRRFKMSLLDPFNTLYFLYYEEKSNILHINEYSIVNNILEEYFDLAYYHYGNFKEYMEAFEDCIVLEVKDLRENNNRGNKWNELKNSERKEILKIVSKNIDNCKRWYWETNNKSPIVEFNKAKTDNYDLFIRENSNYLKQEAFSHLIAQMAGNELMNHLHSELTLRIEEIRNIKIRRKVYKRLGYLINMRFMEEKLPVNKFSNSSEEFLIINCINRFIEENPHITLNKFKKEIVPYILKQHPELSTSNYMDGEKLRELTNNLYLSTPTSIRKGKGNPVKAYKHQKLTFDLIMKDAQIKYTKRHVDFYEKSIESLIEYLKKYRLK